MSMVRQVPGSGIATCRRGGDVLARKSAAVGEMMRVPRMGILGTKG
jgi:hypothetical protein